MFSESMCDVKSGYCTCPVGGNCSPCKHKSAVSKHFKEAHFTIAASHDSRQRALYHFIALGKTLPAHMYRNIGDDCSVEDIEHFIQEKLFVEEGQIEQECVNENEEDCEVQDNTECADEVGEPSSPQSSSVCSS